MKRHPSFRVIRLKTGIVRPMIDANIQRYQNDRTAFVHLDITSQPFPKADLWICRDCFYHLSLDDISKALQRFIDSEISYLLASTYSKPVTSKNYDIASGDFRPTDLFARPFLLPQDVLFRIKDNTTSDLCLWSREQVIAAMPEQSAGSTGVGLSSA